MPLPSGFPVHMLHVRRYDVDLVPCRSDPRIGDRVGVLMPPERKDEVRRFFGDTVKAAAEFSYVSLGLGMVLGVLLGLIPIPIPGVGTVSTRYRRGPAVSSPCSRQAAPDRSAVWVMPLPANIVLRNFGLALFLATVGINAGQPFVNTVSETGFSMLLIGAAVLLTTVANCAAGRVLLLMRFPMTICSALPRARREIQPFSSMPLAWRRPNDPISAMR